jgi:O-antigen/teichoic acid export membrane protein
MNEKQWGNSKIALNLSASFINLSVSLIIGFFLTPYLVRKISGEAYGFLGLSNDFVGYAAIATIALNSVAGRFVSISVHRGKIKDANEYLSAVFVSNFALVALMLPLAIAFIYRIDLVFRIPQQLVMDVKMLFLLSFLNFGISMVGVVYSVAAYVANKYYISNLVSACSSIIKIGAIFSLLLLFPAKIAFVAASAVAASMFALIANIYFTHKMFPTFAIKFKYFSLPKIKKLISSGGWNVVTRLSLIMSDGLDLVMVNEWIGSYAMGQYAIAKTIVNVMSMYISSITNIFGPQLTILYAVNDKDGIVSEIKKNMKISAFLSNLPFCFLVVFGDIFYSLWVPNQNTRTIQILTLLCSQAIVVSGATTVLYNVFLITNNLKIPSMVWLGISLFDVLMVFLLVKYGHLGVYAIAGVSTSVGVIVLLTFVPMYACRCLGVKILTFHPFLVRFVVVNLIIAGCMLGIRSVSNYSKTWVWLFAFGICTGLLGIIVNYLMLFDSKDRNYFNQWLMAKISQRRHQYE